ncbi:unnamed protein product [Protopolystoma xenopodis]|uniref:Uncharacterized protein n=1 Tax=Protopolystoma xenopodis TaxID=117903 RepID=A0A3S5FE41_9PLAT|nr:unnamed protein product [Protopolystoma xenopodis]
MQTGEKFRIIDFAACDNSPMPIKVKGHPFISCSVKFGAGVGTVAGVKKLGCRRRNHRRRQIFFYAVEFSPAEFCSKFANLFAGGKMGKFTANSRLMNKFAHH